MANSEPDSEHKIHKQRKLNFLYISIIAHILLGLLAAYLIVQVVMPRAKPKFTALPPSQMAVHPDVQKQQQVKRQNMQSAPSMVRITANVVSNVTLPAMPNVPQPNPAMGAGTTMGAGTGTGFGTGTGPAGGGPHAFGLRHGIGLKGIFYDFKQTNNGQPTDMSAMSNGTNAPQAQARYAQLMVQFSRTFDTHMFDSYYRAPDPLYSPFIFYPYIPSEEAPKAFGVSDKVKMGNWCVVYTGNVSPPVGGTYHFVGLGDDVLLVRFNGQTVLDHGSFSWGGAPGSGLAKTQSQEWNPKFFKSYLYTNMANGSDKGFYKAMHGQMVGKPITVTQGMSYPIEIVIGDWGGLTQIQVLLQKDGVEYQKDPGGSPILPIFCVSQGGAVKIPNFSEAKSPPYDHNPPAWSIWKLNKESAFFHSF